VRYWLTINEPMVYVKTHYAEGAGPPGVTELRGVYRVIEHLIRAHAASYHTIHHAAPTGGTPPQVSMANNLPVFLPCRRWWWPDRWAMGFVDRFFNQALIEAVTEGRWSVPGVATWNIPDARATLDFLGLNFYSRHFIRWRLHPGRLPVDDCWLDHHNRDVKESTLMGWDVNPGAFTDVLLRWKYLGLPIFITENGVWDEPDERRWQFIARHLAAMGRAIEGGAKIMGYLYWSLLDNFEWGQGYRPRFGLIEVDYATQQRRIRNSARRYAQVCRSNAIDI
jgi:beta-glucosidase